MRWGSLPVDGGIYDQDPEFIDGISLIFEARGQRQSAEKRRTEWEARNNASRIRNKSR